MESEAARPSALSCSTDDSCVLRRPLPYSSCAAVAAATGNKEHGIKHS